MKKISSLSIFFPFLNDEATVSRQIICAYSIGKEVASDLEVIALHGGNSRDKTFKKIKEMKMIFPNLKIINRPKNNEGYAVIKYGFKKATKDWVFYTDGDAQYHLEENLPKLVKKQMETGATIINGYKIRRHDNILRVLLGNIYRLLAKFIFKLPIRDIDCDFRLIKKSLLNKVNLESKDASILTELIKKLQFAGGKFSEVPVGHYSRTYGKSNYKILDLIKEKILGDIKLYLSLRKKNLIK
ncbi:MAG: glycosyltransferase family 2 protein [Patescibacteria group bacterium]